MEGFSVARRIRPGVTLEDPVCAYCKQSTRNIFTHECRGCGTEFGCTAEMGCSPHIDGKPGCADCAIKRGLLKKPSEQPVPGQDVMS